MSKIQTEAIQIYIGIFLWTLSFPVLLPTLIFLSCWKCVVLLYIKIRYFKATPNPLLVPTNVSDTMYSITELTNTISYAFIGDGMIDIDKLRTHFYNTFIEDGKDEQYPLFHQTVTTILGFCYKIRVPLDLSRQIREEEFHPGQETENEVLLRIARNNSELRGNRPKWEIVLLQNRIQGKSTMIWKFNHILVDAYSVRALVAVFANNHATYRTPELCKEKGTLFWVKIFARIPALLLQTYIDVRHSNFGHPFLGLGSKDTEQQTGHQASNTFSNRYWSKAGLEFSKLSEISKKSGCRIGSICTSLYISTLRRTMMERGKWDETRVLRDTPIFYKLPAPGHPADFGKYCNHSIWAYVNAPLKINNKITQLKMIHERMEDYEKSDVGTAVLLLELLLAPILPKFVTYSLINWCASGLGFVNVQNPFIFSSEKYRILGVGVTNLYFLTDSEHPLNTKGVAMTPLTILGNQISFSILGSEDVFESQEDAEAFSTNFVDEVKCLGRDVEKWASSKKIGKGKTGKNKKVQFKCV